MNIASLAGKPPGTVCWSFHLHGQYQSVKSIQMSMCAASLRQRSHRFLLRVSTPNKTSLELYLLMSVRRKDRLRRTVGAARAGNRGSCAFLKRRLSQSCLRGL